LNFSRLSIQNFNESLHNLEILSNTIKDNIAKFSDAHNEIKALNVAIIEEMNSTIANMRAGEHKLSEIKNDTCYELKNTLKKMGLVRWSSCESDYD
jgi:hypothetical protein